MEIHCRKRDVLFDAAGVPLSGRFSLQQSLFVEVLANAPGRSVEGFPVKSGFGFPTVETAPRHNVDITVTILIDIWRES